VHISRQLRQAVFR